MNNWDKYFHEICNSVASKSPCLSRQIGALIVRDNSIISTGYNGPPRGIPHCGGQRYMMDDVLFHHIENNYQGGQKSMFNNTCPRKVLGYESGTHMELCPAQHAEENAISNAARNGVSVLGCTLYLNTCIPCQKCFGTLINAGIKEVVCEELYNYDQHTQFLINNSTINIRLFDI